MRIEPLSALSLADSRDEMAGLLCACVNAGGSLNFLAPMPAAEARDYWTSVGAEIDAGTRLLLVARDGPQIVGSAQLAFTLKPNGRHRAEVNKVMVLPSHRRRGIAAQLMNELERHAKHRSIRLLVLDTAEGPSGARAFYESLGYTYVGGIPDYAVDPFGAPAKNAIYYKPLALE